MLNCPLLYAYSATAMASKLTDLEKTIVQFARDSDLLAELCEFVEYDPEIGRVPGYWQPRYHVLHLARYLTEKLPGREGQTS